MEDIEKKPLKKLILSNRKILISFGFVLLILAAFLWWSDSTAKKERYKNSEDFINAKVYLSQNNDQKSLEILTDIINRKDKVYSPLSLFLIIDKDLEKNKDNIAKYFDQIISIKNLENEDKNLIKLKKAIFISERADEADLISLLNPVLNSDSVWRYQSLKFLGDYYFSKKEFNKAKQYYSDILTLNNSNNDLSDINRKIKIINNE